VSIVFELNTGDLSPSLEANLQNPDGPAVTLQNATVTFTLRKNGSVLFSKTAAIVDSSNGVVRYDWQSGDTNYSGICEGSFTITFPTGLTQTFPVGSKLYVIFSILTSVAEVVAHLNCSDLDTSGNYVVFGLPVSQTALQAHVVYANKYVFSYVPDLVPSDPRWVNAELAALNIACLRTLVAASGGMLLGAFDYRLGDLFITKGSVAKAAFEDAVKVFKVEAVTILMNFATVAKSVNSARQIPSY